MTKVEDFIAQHDGPQGVLLGFLHILLAEELALEPKLRYGIPFYYQHSWVCYLNPRPDGAVELAFPRGNELSNAQGLLEAKDRKMVRSVQWHQAKDVPLEPVLEIIQEALLLDESKPYNFRNRTK